MTRRSGSESPASGSSYAEEELVTHLETFKMKLAEEEERKQNLELALKGSAARIDKLRRMVENTNGFLATWRSVNVSELISG